MDNKNVELDALNAVVKALQPLPSDARERVVESALLLLGNVRSSVISRGPANQQPAILSTSDTGRGPQRSPTDVRQLKEEKGPKSANEMAALVAYYLAEIAQGSEKRDSIGIAEIEKFFKQAQFRLPQNSAMTLVNAKNAGYFDAVGGGRYKLNPVGYNLVVHSLPRSEGAQRIKSKSKR